MKSVYTPDHSIHRFTEAVTVCTLHSLNVLLRGRYKSLISNSIFAIPKLQSVWKRKKDNQL